MRHNKPYSGFFLSIEGGDGAGKSTLALKVGAELEKIGYKVVRTREPGGTFLGEKIREIILNPQSKISDRAELFLFLSARVEHLEEVILPHLQKGGVVITERFNDSTVAYQGCARHLGMAYVEELCSLATLEIEPDLTLFLDVEPEIGLKRAKEREGKKDRIESEELQFHQEVRQGFLHLADDYSERIVVLNANESQEKVLQSAMEAIRPRLPK